jgi:hypothetical protein
LFREQVTNGGKKGFGNQHRFEAQSMRYFEERGQSDVAGATLDARDLRLGNAETLAELYLGEVLALPFSAKLPDDI